MSDFTLGPVKVIDNGDGIYQEPVKGAKTTQDQIVDASGKTVASSGAEAKAALQALGIRSFQGLRLSPASRYLEAMGQAQGFAASGDSPRLQERLLQARLAAAEAKIPFSETRAEALLKKGLLKELDQIVDRAKVSAGSGNVLHLQDALSAGREILGRLQLSLDQAKTQGLPLTADVITQLETQGYANALPAQWKQAEAAAQSGEVPRYREAQLKIRQYSDRAGQALSAAEEKKLEALENEALRVSVDVHLAEAATLAKQGDVERTRFHIRTAEDAALEAKKPLSAKQKFRRNLAEREALKNAPDFLLALAEPKADAGDPEAVRALIQEAKDCRAQLGRTLSAAEGKWAQALEEKALQLSVDVLLKKASRHVDQIKKDGNLTQLRAWLDQARANAALVGTVFSAAQETSASQITTQAYAAAVTWRFNQAEASAKLGKVDDTIVPLNAGRELAKQGKVPFDETKAKTLTDLALTNGVELEFKIAEKIAASGDRRATQRHLDQARENGKRVGLSFDQARAEKILNSIP